MDSKPQPRNPFERELFALLRKYGGEYEYDDSHIVVRNDGTGELELKRKYEPRGLPSLTPNLTGRRLRGEFITTMLVPGKNRPKKRMLCATKLDDETIEFHLFTMGNHHAKSYARRWRN